ncbi:MAG TPA: hypothetical protein VGL60_07765 [Acidimicrobiales bacterium]|jgi:hypothetical protein
MQRLLLERRIRDVHERLVRARGELAVIDEQLDVMSDAADDARIRSLVAETPLAARDYDEARRHADVLVRARQALLDTLGDLQRRQDELLMRVGPGRP